ncbi:MAG: hypothetical protein GY950_19260 [bacterium]|nr:hypothetical protein [bacterium]
METLSKEVNARSINTPGNEFLEKKQELFNLYLKMPVQFKEDWKLFRKRCKKQGFEFEDVLGNLIIRFSKGEIEFKKYRGPNE